MHVVVVGCGRVGSSLARSVLEAGHTVAVVDRRSEAFVRLGPDFQGQTVEGIGFDRDRLIEAGIEGAIALASVTNGDNSNVLIARVARETFAVEHVVARIYDPRRAAIYQRLGLTTVATVAWTTDQVFRRLLPAETPPEWTDPSASVSLIERPVPNAWAGRLLGEVEELVGGRVVAVGRLGKALVPTAGTNAQQGDLLYLAVLSDRLAAIDRALAAGPGSH
ncbi:MAG: potassium channel family protein [Ilumatobacteraceae bacterium]